jgi:general secretion pathway protein K
MKGFVLVTTLWILAIITIAASFFALWTQQTLSLALNLQQDVQGEIDVQSTESSLIYLLSTQSFTVAGMTVTQHVINFDNDEDIPFLPVGQEIALDDRPYLGHGSARFALQDERGLLNLNLLAGDSEDVNSPLVRRSVRLLGLLGVKAELREPLISKLRDYVDSDNNHRLNGAEEYHYKERGLPLPSNKSLLQPMECLRILDWAEQENLSKNGLWGQLTTTALAGDTNINTAPLLILQSIEGINAVAANRIMAARQEMAFFDGTTLSSTAGVAFSDDPFELGLSFYPSDFIRITLWHDNAKYVRQIHLQRTPSFDKGTPWIIDYAIELPLMDNYSKIATHHAHTPIFNSTLSTETQ